MAFTILIRIFAPGMELINHDLIELYISVKKFSTALIQDDSDDGRSVVLTSLMEYSLVPLS